MIRPSIILAGFAILIAVGIPAAAPLGVAGEYGNAGKRSSYGLSSVPLVSDHLNIRDHAGNGLVRIEGGETTWTVSDHLGSMHISLEDGKTGTAHAYAPHGTPSVAVGARYAGHPYSPNQNLYQTPTRPYDPSLGRFLSIDPLRQGPSPYSYAGNDPIGNVDPTGGIYIPFFIRSGFKDYPSSHTYVSFAANSARTAIHSGERQRPIYPDHSYFSYEETQVPGERFKRLGSRHINYASDPNERFQHNDTVYWMVGGEEPVRKPLDVATVFERWRSMRPGIASKIIIVDTSGDLDQSALIRQSLREANLAFELVRTTFTFERTSPRTRQVNQFVVGNETMNRSAFRMYMRRTVAAVDAPTRMEPNAVPTSSIVPEVQRLAYGGTEQPFETPIRFEENPRHTFDYDLDPVMPAGPGSPQMLEVTDSGLPHLTPPGSPSMLGVEDMEIAHITPTTTGSWE